MTKFTNETAFSDISHRYIIPNKLRIIIDDVNKINNEEITWKSVKMNAITVIIANELLIDIKVSDHMLRYCSKNT